MTLHREPCHNFCCPVCESEDVEVFDDDVCVSLCICNQCKQEYNVYLKPVTVFWEDV